MKLQDLFENESLDYELMSEQSLFEFLSTNLIQLPKVVQDLKANNMELPEKVQVWLCNRSQKAIEYIIESGIIPSERVQQAACQKFGGAIDDIIQVLKPLGKFPSEKVQMIACKQWGYAIEHIIDNLPSGEIPSERVQELACTNTGSVINYIINAFKPLGKFPSERVQILACNHTGSAIKYIIDANPSSKTVPSDIVQQIACSQDGSSIIYLIVANKPISDKVFEIAFDQLIREHKDDNNNVVINCVLKQLKGPIIPSHVQQHILKEIPVLLIEFPHIFPEFVKPLVDNLRSTLEKQQFSLADVHKFIEAVYSDDEDMATTLKHRANAIQRKLDERKLK